MSEPRFTPGPWHVCNKGGCSCFTVMCADHPVAQVTHGDWGDDYPAIRLVGDSSFDRKAEAYIEQITYGHVNDETARANWHLIAAAPALFHACDEAFWFLGGVDGATEIRSRLLAALNAALSKDNNSLPTPAATPTDSANPPPVESVGPNSEAQS